MTNTRNDTTNIEIAIDLANDALTYLQSAKDKLGSARNWGIMDIIGGGIFTSLIKHNRIREAQNDLDNAKRIMTELSARMDYYPELEHIDLEFDNMLGTFDILFDNPIIDIFMQGKIADAKARIDEAIDMLQDILEILYSGGIAEW